MCMLMTVLSLQLVWMVTRPFLRPPGRLRKLTNPYQTVGSTHKALMQGNLQGNAEGSTVCIRVDMAARSMAVSVNGQPFVDTGEPLPAAGVKLWVSLFCNGDAVELLSDGKAAAYC